MADALTFAPLTDEEKDELHSFIDTPETYAAAEGLSDECREGLASMAVAVLVRDDLDALCDLADAYGRELFTYASHPFVSRVTRRLYEAGVAQGHGGCACNLGAKYYNGEGVARDYEMAARVYAVGRALGSTQAGVNLGYCYLHGRAGEPDAAAAFECFAWAAVLDDNAEALWKLGDLYRKGAGVERDDLTAFRLYERAHDVCHGTAMGARPAHHMADMLLEGAAAPESVAPSSGVVSRSLRALSLYQEAERGYYLEIAKGLTYYRDALKQAIEGQQRARRALAEEA